MHSFHKGDGYPNNRKYQFQRSVIARLSKTKTRQSENILPAAFFVFYDTSAKRHLIGALPHITGYFRYISLQYISFLHIL